MLHYVSRVENFFARHLGGRCQALLNPEGANVEVQE